MATNKVKRTYEATHEQLIDIDKALNYILGLGARDEGRAYQLMAQDVLSGVDPSYYKSGHYETTKS